MAINADLSTERGRRQFIAQLVTRIRDDRRVGTDLAVDEYGVRAAVFTAKPDRRVYYVERLDAGETEGGRLLILKPNRTRRPTQNPMKLARGQAYDTSVSPQAFVHALPAELFRERTDLSSIRRWVLENIRMGSSQTLLNRQQVRSDRHLQRLYERTFR